MQTFIQAVAVTAFIAWVVLVYVALPVLALVWLLRVVL